MISYILYFLLFYFVIVFILPILIIPHMRLKDGLPKNIPIDIQKKIEEIKLVVKTPEEFLQKSYDFLGNKYHSERLATILKFPYLFKDLDEVWGMEGYVPCTLSNFLLTIFLVKSNFFKAEDIKRRYVFVNFVPHQYLKVKLGSKWVDVDVGEKQRGMPMGKYLRFFG